MIFRDLATTGDGILTGLLLLDVVAPQRSDRWPTWPPAAMTRLPQVLVNVRVAGSAPASPTRIAAEIAAAERRPRDRPAGCWCGRAAPSRSCG